MQLDAKPIILLKPLLVISRSNHFSEHTPATKAFCVSLLSHETQSFSLHSLSSLCLVPPSRCLCFPRPRSVLMMTAARSSDPCPVRWRPRRKARWRRTEQTTSAATAAAMPVQRRLTTAAGDGKSGAKWWPFIPRLGTSLSSAALPLRLLVISTHPTLHVASSMSRRGRRRRMDLGQPDPVDAAMEEFSTGRVAREPSVELEARLLGHGGGAVVRRATPGRGGPARRLRGGGGTARG